MQIFAGVRWRGGVKWEWGCLKWRFSLHSFTVFRTFFINGFMTAFRWYDCQWPWAYFRVIGLFHIKFLKNGVWYGKSYYQLLIGNHTLAFDWCHFWWPWSTFEGHFSLGCHFHVHFSNPWHAFASHGLPANAIAELLVDMTQGPRTLHVGNGKFRATKRGRFSVELLMTWCHQTDQQYTSCTVAFLFKMRILPRCTKLHKFAPIF